MTANIEPDLLKEWIGRQEQARDVVTQAPLDGLAATLDHASPPWTKGEVPPLGHWLNFLPRALHRDIAADGHPHRGGFLPPVPLPRRMWAGGTLKFLAPLRVGETITRRSTIRDVAVKTGRSGTMVFVAVHHEVSNDAGVALTEIHDIVYREAPAPEAPTRQTSTPEAPTRQTSTPEPGLSPAPALWRRPLTPDPVLLFRYSALTFNGHRIHYDRDYCRDEEGYPGLIFHGPLTATLLVDLFLRHNPGARVTGFSFRARRPLFDIHPLTLCGDPRPGGATLWAENHLAQVAMTAELEAQ